MSDSSSGPAGGAGTAPPGTTRLLVSVRNVVEARAAVHGGADIIDVKEPRRGSLGMADADVIADVAATVRESPTELPVSAALGELMDDQRKSFFLPVGLSYVKLGLAGTAVLADWRDRWCRFREEFGCRCEFAVNWVGVAYADAELAESPPVEEVIAASAEAGCAGVLIDTFAKTEARLLDFVCVNQLMAWANGIHASGMFMALAGQIQACDLPALDSVPADIIAVRSAVCIANQRHAVLSADRVAELRRHLRPAVTPVAAEGATR